MQENLTKENLKSRLLLVDGHNLLFQMFYGMPARIKGKNGKSVHGVLGFTAALLKIIKMIKPTHLAVLFDGEHANERCEINCDYKANRPNYSELSEEDNPFTQLDDIYRVLDYLKIRHCECDFLECDDAIASYALTYGEQNEVIISSFDSDFFQLVTKNVKVLRYRGDYSTICDVDFLMQKYGISPDKYADFKCLTGDSADNVKGAPGIGPKTAALLINEYGTLHSLIDRANEITKPKIRQSVSENAKRLRDNYEIIKLTKKNPPNFSLDQLIFSQTDSNTSKILKELEIF